MKEIRGNIKPESEAPWRPTALPENGLPMSITFKLLHRIPSTCSLLPELDTGIEQSLAASQLSRRGEKPAGSHLNQGMEP